MSVMVKKLDTHQKQKKICQVVLIVMKKKQGKGLSEMVPCLRVSALRKFTMDSVRPRNNNRTFLG